MNNEMRESPAGMSMWGLYQTCPKKWSYQYALGWRKDSEDPEYLIHGSAIHEAKKVFYGTHDIEKAIQKGLEFVNEHPGSFNLLSIEERRIEEGLRLWYDTYGKDDLDKFTVLTNEIPDTISLPNGSGITVRPDQIMRENATGNIYIFDTKTTSWSLDNTILDYMYKSQPLLYICAIYRSKPLWITDFRGWITDVLYQRINYKKNGDFSSLSNEVKRSQPIMYSEAQCDLFLDSVEALTTQVASAYNRYKNGEKQSKCFPMNRSSCKSFNAVCTYWPICFTDVPFGTKPQSPFVYDPWREEGVIDHVVNQISL